MPSMPLIEPKIASMDGSFSASLNTPTREALMAHVGPPDCATAIFIKCPFPMHQNQNKCTSSIVTDSWKNVNLIFHFFQKKNRPALLLKAAAGRQSLKW